MDNIYDTKEQDEKKNKRIENLHKDDVFMDANTRYFDTTNIYVFDKQSRHNEFFGKT